MPRTPASNVTVRIDLGRIRANAAEIAEGTGVAVMAVVKADAYGLGAGRIAEAVAPVVAGFCVFALREAVEAELWKRTGKPSLALGPPETLDPRPWIEQRVRPCVATVEQAAALREARPIVCVDTGMQRFACPPENLDAVIEAGMCDEAITHATRLEQVEELKELLRGRGMKLHAAATALLDQPRAWLDAVRPGLAIYRGALRVSTPLVEVCEARGPAGYTGFSLPRHGVIVCGYSNGLSAGVCSVRGRRRKVVEVGMQSAFIETMPEDNVGDEVVLMGDGVTEADLAEHWRCTPHETILRLSGAGRREYL
jgi:alanine racemase